MNYQDWEKSVPEVITSDALWKMKVYRLALFATDIGWEDVSKLAKDLRTRKLSDQLYRALGSIAANIAEGYSRSSGKDRVRFYAYSLGSAREARGWHYQARHLLGEEVALHRMEILTRIAQLLLATIPIQRHKTFKEEQTHYTTQDERRTTHDARRTTQDERRTTQDERRMTQNPTTIKGE